ncbi:RagB/SusD family nutrient uptake outer membrane protein [Wenyingzhuangia sp. 2_MG-2023]|uniref:RagB/SusD family nutrient uptake outer membrane protein n=1 Tax=Wenyingzhuangia sp. 2_MG-2023 TaxID=3062639 RepID=UPI0026E3DED5|nr:RagB/SusD family nutrient uptake outer membrane protein [Wenyingzhuangia sp. 2_MG-2023]MDO6738743.1 RagB/SusD family nutrient uptake outer membrane protein [Wenyingzhuangia sp. 2_MG-2023]
MKTQKIKYYITSLLVGCLFACESYIDVVPDNLPTIDIAFNSRVNAQRFFYTLYSYMPQHANISQNPAFFGGDELWLDREKAISDVGSQLTRGFQSVTSPKYNHWSDIDLFVALRDCNIFLENVYKPQDLDETERSRWIAEAKFLKAYYHFWLLRMYGAIPTIDTNIDVSSGIGDVRIERDKTDDTVNYIVSLLDEAIEGLPPFISSTTDELGRATKPMAAAVKAKILAFAASPLLNGNTAYANWVNNAGEPYINQTFDITKWEKAAVACQEAIDLSLAGGHALYKSTGSAMYTLSDSTLTKLSIRGAISDRWNTEVIWGSLMPSGASIQSHVFPIAQPDVRPEEYAKVPRDYSPTLRMAELFYSDNGVPIEEDVDYDYANRYEVKNAGDDDSYYIEPGYTTAALHFNREPRFHANLFFDGGKIYGQGRFNDKDLYTYKAKKEQSGSIITGTSRNITGYLPKKLSGVNDVLNSNFIPEAYPWPVIRLADMYLLHAECVNEAYGPSGEVYTSLDIVRERAGLDGVLESWTDHSNNPSKPNTKEGLREIIHQERLIELAFEGHRFWDLRRWLKAHEYLNNSEIKGWSVDDATVEGYYRVTIVGETKFLQKNYFWPIAESDIIQNPNLDQSPGW